MTQNPKESEVADSQYVRCIVLASFFILTSLRLPKEFVWAGEKKGGNVKDICYKQTKVSSTVRSCGKQKLVDRSSAGQTLLL